MIEVRVSLDLVIAFAGAVAYPDPTTQMLCAVAARDLVARLPPDVASASCHEARRILQLDKATATATLTMYIEQALTLHGVNDAPQSAVN